MQTNSPDFSQRPIGPGSRLVLIGGHGGIGSRLAAVASELGASVASLDTEATIAARPLPSAVIAKPIDALKPDTIRSALAALAADWSSFDGLVFLTGVSVPPTPVSALTEDDWDRVLSINLRAAFVTLQSAAPFMARPGGAIVTVSSGLAINVERGFAPYAASKAGLIALTKVLAKELAPDVRVNSVAPGLVDTPFISGETWFRDPKVLEQIKASILFGRIATPDDVVGPILFLLSEASRYMTGQTIHVNAGRTMP